MLPEPPAGRMTNSLLPNAGGLEELVRRIVDAVSPLRIVLFGSAARGEMGTDSDVDLLVVVPGGSHRRRTAELIHTRLFGIPFSVDMVVATPDDLAAHAANPRLIYRTALDEGRELYAT